MKYQLPVIKVVPVIAPAPEIYLEPYQTFHKIRAALMKLMAAAAGADDSILSSSAANSGSTHLAHRLILAAPAMRDALAIGSNLAEEAFEPSVDNRSFMAYWSGIAAGGTVVSKCTTCRRVIKGRADGPARTLSTVLAPSAEDTKVKAPSLLPSVRPSAIRSPVFFTKSASRAMCIDLSMIAADAVALMIDTACEVCRARADCSLL